MTVSKNEKGLWDVQFYYKDYRGKNTKKHKRNFKTKKEAVEWANKYIDQQSHNLNMNFSSFCQLYREDMKERLRENTVRTKDYIMERINDCFSPQRVGEGNYRTESRIKRHIQERFYYEKLCLFLRYGSREEGKHTADRGCST